MRVLVAGSLSSAQQLLVRLASSFALTGRITDEGGGPVGGIVVWLWVPGTSGLEGRTDADGAFRAALPPGECEVQVPAVEALELGASHASCVLAQDVHLEIVLPPTFSVRGAVRNPVLVGHAAQLPHAGRGARSAWQDRRPGRVARQADARSVHARRARRSPAVRGPVEQRNRRVLGHGGRAPAGAGRRAVGPTGGRRTEPFLSARLRLAPLGPGRPASGDTEGDGRYALRLRPGRCQVAFLSQGTGSSPSQILDTVYVDADRVQGLRLDPGLPVEGRVDVPAGAVPLGIATAALSAQAGAGNTCSAQADASFTFRLKPAEYDLVGSLRGASFWTAGHLQVPASEPIEVRPPQGAALRGRVQDEAGAPVAGCLVTVARDPRTLVSGGQASSGLVAFSDGESGAVAVLTDAGGMYSLVAAPGTYSVLVLPVRPWCCASVSPSAAVWPRS